ncbi:MAG: hypothetical protein AAGE76_01330 [Pseudomonadota bacterium]
MIRVLTAVLILIAAPALAQSEAEPPAAPPTEPPMTLSRMAEIIFAIDPEAQSAGNTFQMIIDDVPVLIVTDPLADRMRAMVPIRSTEGMTAEEVMRVLQANFDTALDARYAVARGRLWGTFIHPLSPLEKDQLISGLGQTVNIAKTYGSLYTGGALTFGDGDSAQLHRELIDDLLNKAEEI